MTDNCDNVRIPLTEEIKHLRWRLEQTEETRDLLAEHFGYMLDYLTWGRLSKPVFSKSLIRVEVEKALMEFTEDQRKRTDIWQQIANTLASELEEVEQKRDELKATIQEILDILPRKINESDPCPVCWTYTHKGWCWYEQAKAALRGEGE